MADACSDIYAAIARLEAKINGIPRINEQGLIQNVLGQMGNSPVFLDLRRQASGANAKANALGNSLDNLRAGQFQLGNKVNNVAAGVDNLGRNVIDQGNRLGKMGGALADLDHKTNGLASGLQAANARINGVLGKLGPLFNILGTVGAVAGLASLAGTLGVVFPRLDAQDRYMDSLNRGMQDAANLAAGAMFLARDALAAASGANAKADRAINEARAAQSAAGAASAKAEQASGKADTAIKKSDAANATANRASKDAEQAKGDAATAIKEANAATATANKAMAVAEAEAAKAIAKANQAITEANAAKAEAKAAVAFAKAEVGRIEGLANKAIAEANKISDQAQRAIVGANVAAGFAKIASEDARSAANQANLANALAGSAQLSANAASNQANNTANQLAQNPPLSENLLLKTFQQYNLSPNNINQVSAISVQEAGKAARDAIKNAHNLALAEINKNQQENLRRLGLLELQTPEKAGQAARDAIKQSHDAVHKEIEEVRRENLSKLGIFDQKLGLFDQKLGLSQNLNVDKSVAASPEIANLKKDVSQLKTEQNNQNKVNQQANSKLDTIIQNQTKPVETKLPPEANTKLDTIIQNQAKPIETKLPPETNQKLDLLQQTSNAIITITGNIQDIVKGIVDQINRFVNQINNLVNQMSVAINQINGLVSKINTFIADVNRQLQDIGFKLLAILTILQFIRPLISSILTNTVSILSKLGSLARWLRLDRVWNMLIYAGVLHNAWMLSNNFGQTLISATSSFLAAIGIADDEGNPIDVGALIGKQIKETAESIFGKSQVSYWESQYKKYIRVYQAAANIISSLTSIGYSILSVLEVIGSRISRIGNALRFFGVVADKAYAAMNENDYFQNPFFNRIIRLEEAASTIDQVSSEVVNVRQTATQLKTQKKELDDAVKAATATADKAEAKETAKIKVPDYAEAEVT